MAESGRLEEIDCLRGIAVLSVCICHFTGANNGLPNDSLIRSLGAHGRHGVDIFFVISGFIVPYSLWRSGYTPAGLGTFILKRVIRLDPPYVIAIVLAVASAWIAARWPGYKGEPFDVSARQILLHLFYINSFFGYPWVNPVFWTLAIEFQYYLALSLLFPLIVQKSASRRAVLFGVLGALALLLPQQQFLFHYLFLFMLGMLSFQTHAGLLRGEQFLFWLLPLAAGVWLTVGDLPAVVGTLTSLVIAFVRFKSVFLQSLGTISYSLYLIHLPAGARCVNFGGRFVDGLAQSIALITLALAVSVLLAWGLYVFVEKPAQQWSLRVRYRRPAPIT
jgi:peptidoglycan/LPS O-acetylase OafA/YrhL